jgi:hypothetical protein
MRLEKMLTFISLKENGWNDYGKRPYKQGKDIDLVVYNMLSLNRIGAF